MHSFAKEGKGIIAAPTAFGSELRRLNRMQVVKQAKRLRQNFYAISVDRRGQNPVVLAIIQKAQRELFGKPPTGDSSSRTPSSTTGTTGDGVTCVSSSS